LVAYIAVPPINGTAGIFSVDPFFTISLQINLKQQTFYHATITNYMIQRPFSEAVNPSVTKFPVFCGIQRFATMLIKVHC
jgi:hypothetical protein